MSEWLAEPDIVHATVEAIAKERTEAARARKQAREADRAKKRKAPRG